VKNIAVFLMFLRLGRSLRAIRKLSKKWKHMTQQPHNGQQSSTWWFLSSHQ